MRLFQEAAEKAGGPYRGMPGRISKGKESAAIQQ